MLVACLLLAGCFSQGPGKHEPSSSSTQTLDDPRIRDLNVIVPWEESGEYQVLVNGVRAAYLNITLSHRDDDTRAQIQFDKTTEKQTARADYERGTGRLQHLLVTSRSTTQLAHDADEFWPNGQESLVPLPNPAIQIVDVLPLGGRFLAHGFNPLGIATSSQSSTDEEWSWKGHVPCQAFCKGEGQEAILHFNITLEGRKGFLPTRTIVQAVPGGATIQLDQKGATHSLDTTSLSPEYNPPEAFQTSDCGLVPCDGAAQQIQFMTGFNALQQHPIWLTWSQANPNWFLLGATASLSGPVNPTTERLQIWTFDAIQEGNPLARFRLQKLVTTDGPPLLTEYNPALVEWNPVWMGTASRTQWPSMDHVVQDWTSRFPKDPTSSLGLTLLFFDTLSFPDPERTVTISMSWIAPDNRVVVMTGYAGDGLARQALWSSNE